jgi:hypothetical protein
MQTAEPRRAKSASKRQIRSLNMSFTVEQMTVERPAPHLLVLTAAALPPPRPLTRKASHHGFGLQQPPKLRAAGLLHALKTPPGGAG